MHFISSAHLVSISCWPFISSLGVYFLLLGLIGYLNNFGGFISGLGALVIASIMFVWFGDVLKENLAGFHNSYVRSTLRTGMIFFILSEIFFFFGFFWGYFHSIFNIENEDVAFTWIWKDAVEWDVPLFNTVLLVSSGVFLTWAHQELIVCCNTSGSFFFLSRKRGPSSSPLGYQRLQNFIIAYDLTLFLGILFLGLQYMEFELNEFAMNSAVFGRAFYLLTGFHGMHVFVGVIILRVFVIRFVFNVFGGYNSNHFMMATWYWHFVDVVWLFLFIFLYPSDWSDFVSFLRV